MSLQIWLAFIATTCFISATPGPNMLLMISHGARYGWRATTATMAGTIVGLALLLSASAMGVSTILAASAPLFTALKMVGALYLLYLGYQCWHAGSQLSLPNANADTPRARFRTGLTIALSNPKAILFAGAFLPQFINPSLPQGPQWLILLSSFFVIELSWQLIYALGGMSLARWLASGQRIKAFNRSCALAFFAVGGALAFAKR
ncbi:LysE family translocator [Deefgea salmonis]|uniref:LysE family translocator n=1 Tax=Deefgea salmonis TaxID=2875502 RepID=A0ABS8BMY1_9NEIS|nr:LysE family translocator [Deefgea salmonis]MCB5196906.1 LysE family translocator [Deefgea salmonis]